MEIQLARNRYAARSGRASWPLRCLERSFQLWTLRRISATLLCWATAAGSKSALQCEKHAFVMTKAITPSRLAPDSTTVSDFDDEEKKRQYSIKTSVIPKSNSAAASSTYWTTPATLTLLRRSSEIPARCGCTESALTANPASPSAPKGWKSLADAGLPAMFYVSKLDEEHANFFNTFDSLRDIFGASVIPFTFPILHGERGRRRCRSRLQEGLRRLRQRRSPCPPRRKREDRRVHGRAE